jgi:hypothetical protein
MVEGSQSRMSSLDRGRGATFRQGDVGMVDASFSPFNEITRHINTPTFLTFVFEVWALFVHLMLCLWINIEGAGCLNQARLPLLSTP